MFVKLEGLIKFLEGLPEDTPLAEIVEELKALRLATLLELPKLEIEPSVTKQAGWVN